MADEYIDKVEVGAKIQMMYIRREMDYGGENDFCRGMRKALRVIENMPAADVQPALNEKEYESLCKRMAECVNMGVEDGHIAADDILLEALEKMGYEKLVNLYRDLDKWYA